MQSKIRIEFDFDINEPVFQVTLEKKSDDLRDQMLAAFIEKAGLPENRIYLTYRYDQIDKPIVSMRVGKILPMSEFKTNLTFGQALEAIKEGFKVRLPEWVGYWYKKNGEIWVHKEDGTEVDTPWFKETVFRNDWQIAE